MTILLAVAALLALALVPMSVRLWLTLPSLPTYRRVANMLYPTSQFVVGAYCVWAAGRYGFDPALVLLICVGLVACVACDPIIFRELLAAERRDLSAECERLLGVQVEAQKEHLNRMRSTHATAVGIREGVRGRLAEVERSLASGDEVRARALLRDAADVVRPADMTFCAHPVVDALLASKATLCRERGIRLDVAAQVSRSCGVTDAELCAVFSNLLDNAIKACDGLPLDTRWVSLRACEDKGCLVVDVRNACEGTAASPACRLGDKVPEHGWGQSILAAIAERHGGDFECGREGGEYRASILLLADAQASRAVGQRVPAPRASFRGFLHESDGF